MGLHGTIKTAYLTFGNTISNNHLIDYKWFLEQEVNSWKYWVDFPIVQRLWLWRHGFTSPYGKLYDLETHGADRFLSELQRYRLYKSMNGHHRYLVDDKLSEHWMLSDFPEHRPTAYGLIDRGFIHGVAGTELAGKPIRVSEWLPSAVHEHEKLVLKHLRGKGGKEVLICEYDDGFVLDGESVNEETLCETAETLSGYLVTEYINQHEYADTLYPHATNTIRLITLWDDDQEEIFTPVAAHRIGVERSRPIDNFSAGGLSAEIDLETGELGPGVQFPFNGELSWYSTHPDTGVQIEGTTVPHWKTIRDTIEHLALQNTNIPAIGWDIILDQSGTPIVIEANTGTDFDMVQVHRPLLDDDRVVRLVSNHLPEIDPPS